MSVLTKLQVNINEIVRTIESGGVVIFPTETVYALACDLYSSSSIARLKNIKNREAKKPLSVLCKDFFQMSELVKTTSYESFIKKYIPGPVTFVLECQDKYKYLLHDLNQQTPTLGVRIPDHVISQAILAKLNKPIIATSVNYSGQKAATNIQEVPKEILSQADYILDGGESLIGVSSTVIDLSQNKMKILRQGSIKIEV